MKKLSLIGSSVCLLWGCASFHSKPLSPEGNIEAFGSRTLGDPALARLLGPRPASWDLETLTLAAFYSQPDLAVARAQWQAALAAVRTASERPNPTLTVGPVEWVSN